MNLNPLTQIEPVTIGATVALFTGTYVVLRKTVLVPLVTVMEDRRERIEASLAAAEEARRLVCDAESRAEERLRLARLEGNQVIDAVRGKAEQRRDELLAAAEQEAAALLDVGRAKSAKLREIEMLELRREALDCVELACEKLLVPVGEGTVRSTVDDVIASSFH